MGRGSLLQKQARLQSEIALMIYKIVRNLRVAVADLAGDGIGGEKSLSEDRISIVVNGRPVQVAPGTSVAAAVMMARETCRVSIEGEARTPLCGMGICMECRLTINGVAHQRSCQLICAAGMEVATG